MRGTRWLILVAIVLLLGGVAATYRLQKRELREEAPAKPAAMAPELMSAAQDWVHIETSEPPESRTICRITAKDVRQAKDSNQVELEQVELRLPSMHTDTYNLVHSAHAEYHQADKRLYSDGAVDITLAVPNEGQPKHTLVSIHSSGVTFDSGTGKAATDRAATFRFENGEGRAVGASYDPSTRELDLNSQAELHWNPPGPHAKPMKIEAGQVIYRENMAGIWLIPWSRLTRDNTIVEAGETVIALQDGYIHHVDAQKAHGTDSYPSRKLQYGADHLSVDYDDTGAVEKITGEGNARLISDSEGSNYRNGRQGGPAIRGLQWREHDDNGGGQRPRVPGIETTGDAGPRSRRDAHPAQRDHPDEDAARRAGDRQPGNARTQRTGVPAQPGQPAPSQVYRRAHVDQLRSAEPHRVVHRRQLQHGERSDARGTGQEASRHHDGEQECFGGIRSENQPVDAHGTMGRFFL